MSSTVVNTRAISWQRSSISTSSISACFFERATRGSGTSPPLNALDIARILRRADQFVLHRRMNSSRLSRTGRRWQPARSASDADRGYDVARTPRDPSRRAHRNQRRDGGAVRCTSMEGAGLQAVDGGTFQFPPDAGPHLRGGVIGIGERKEFRQGGRALRGLRLATRCVSTVVFPVPAQQSPASDHERVQWLAAGVHREGSSSQVRQLKPLENSLAGEYQRWLWKAVAAFEKPGVRLPVSSSGFRFPASYQGIASAMP